MDQKQRNDLTQALPSAETQAIRRDDDLGATQIHRFRCTCGNEFQIDPVNGGTCEKCGRVIPAAATHSALTMTIMRLDESANVEHPRAFANRDSEDPLIGRKLGHFEILDVIGSGGMGNVYRALDTSLQRYVAVKVLSHGQNESGIDTEGKQSLLREAIAQARVNHPNIVTIYYVGHEEEIPFLAMELIDGYDASELTRQGTIPYDHLCQIAIKIADALQSAAKYGIVHADIKPQNMLVMSDGNIKLSDFGMARFQDQQDQTVGGTPNYLAPELLHGAQPTIQSDMYALGATLFEMTFGQVPVQLTGRTIKEWSRAHESSTIKFPEKWPDHLPEGWRDLLLKLLDKDPANRYESYEELNEVLAKLLPGKSQPAKMAPRVIALLIDFMVLGVCVLPFSFIGLAMGWDPDFTSKLMMLPELLLFTSIEYWWRQTIGRELMHVKIVNRYGLKPTRKLMAARSTLRLMGIWGSSLMQLGEVMQNDVLFYLGTLPVIYFIVDALHMLIFRGRQTLTDRITQTKAVVGSNSR